MDRLRRLWEGQQEYEPIDNGAADSDEQEEERDVGKRGTFSYVEYCVFVLLGVSMLWAWNMFLAAGPYLQHRFRGNRWILDNFQAAEASVSTITNLLVMLILTRLQANASYPRRIVSALFISMATFGLLALSTEIFVDVSAGVYFGFIMVMMLASSFATGLSQNGIFAYVSGFGQPTYIQGIMTGQAIAGVLPSILEIVSVLSVQGDTPPPDQDSDDLPGPPPVRSNAAAAYFSTATAIAVVTLLAFSFLLARHRSPKKTQDTSSDRPDDGDRKKEIPLSVLFRRLFWLSIAMFITFGGTMSFPVFTQKIISVRPPEDQPPLLQPPSFIPLAFLFWNSGDLLGRLVTAVPSLSLVHRPRVLFILSVSRLAFIGLYYLCNVNGRGAIVESDFFYLVVVQLFFGLSNGYLGSMCMIGASEWVEPDEREVAGSFMGLCLVAGLCVGSLLSFLVS